MLRISHRINLLPDFIFSAGICSELCFLWKDHRFTWTVDITCSLNFIQSRNPNIPVAQDQMIIFFTRVYLNNLFLRTVEIIFDKLYLTMFMVHDFHFPVFPQKPLEALNLLVTEERYWALFYMSMYTFIHSMLNVLVQIANKMGLQKLSLYCSCAPLFQLLITGMRCCL
jgi:hypothetical protein